MVEIIFLGTGNAFGHGGRLHSSYIIRGSRTVLMDAGPSLLPGLHREGIDPRDIDIIVLSHLHADHMGGLPYFMLDDKWITKRAEPLKVLGPPGTKELVESLCGILYSDKEVGHIPNVFEFIDFNVGDTHEVFGIKFEGFEAIHTANPKMIKIWIDGKVIGYSGDTAFHEASFLEILDADATIHECSSYDLEIPNHVSFVELTNKLTELSDQLPSQYSIYLSHVHTSLDENRDKIVPPIYLASDGLRILLN